jgi:hypothetical protein
MKLKYIALLVSSVLFLSCDGPNDPIPRANTASSFASPETVGELADGRIVKCVVRDRGYNHPHYIYFVENADGGKTVTTNQAVSAGKSTRNQVTVLIDGVKYTATPENE